MHGLAERGARVKLLTNFPEIAEGTGVPVREVDLGPKLSRRSVVRVALGFLPWLLRLLRELRRERAEAGPIDVLLVHYKKEQLMAALVPRRLARTVVWAEWGPVPFEFRRGLPRLLYRLAARRAARIAAISAGTKQLDRGARRAGRQDRGDPERDGRRRDPLRRRGARALPGRVGSDGRHLRDRHASRACTRRSATTC